MRIGTVVNRANSVIDLTVDGTGVLRVQIDTLVPDEALMLCLADTLKSHEGVVSVVAGLAIVSLPAAMLLDRFTLRALVEESAYRAEVEFRAALGVEAGPRSPKRG